MEVLYLSNPNVFGPGTDGDEEDGKHGRAIRSLLGAMLAFRSSVTCATIVLRSGLL